MKKLIFLDTETTGNDVLKDRLCQVCYKTNDGIYQDYFKPPVAVSVKAMSITHITNKMLEDKEPFRDSTMKKELQALLNGGILVAHNARFDCAMLEVEGMNIPHRICTFRVARGFDEKNQIPEYGLQFLRYYLDLDVGDVTAHDAVGDVAVLHALFQRLLAKIMKDDGITEEEAIAKMIDISARPVLFKYFPFGKYRDKKIEEVAKTDRNYLQWLLDAKLEEGGHDEDWMHTLQYFLKDSR